ncbi:hypothetical protein [Wolbachia endosymbiont (group E) of Neria commutata]|uniref:hypothetical protein n=1 Tax=Wolbachia endosymbiont (group E) of Neria commutata TaxID=3066149 RepID=UPI003132D8C1
MLTYNFFYPHQQGISYAYHYPYSTSNSGNTLVLNFSMPNSYYDDDDGNREVGIDKGTGETGKDTGKDGKGEAGKGTGNWQRHW